MQRGAQVEDLLRLVPVLLPKRVWHDWHIINKVVGLESMGRHMYQAHGVSGLGDISCSDYI